MSTLLIDHNKDLCRLRDEGYNISIIENHIIINDIPYLNEKCQIKFGAIFCAFNLIGQNEVKQNDHTVYFTGEYPCDKLGNRQTTFVHSEQNIPLTSEIVGRYYFSTRPANGSYGSFYEKFSKYIELLMNPALSIDPSISAKHFDAREYQENSIFLYPDTNTARAEITSISNKLKNLNIAIVGLGGTGSYLLDFISKTPVKNIAIFDGDILCNHNGFRLPGVISLEELSQRPSKVDFLKARYDKFREGIAAFNVFIKDDNVNLLSGNDFVFLSIDSSEDKKIIIDYLIEQKIPFTDSGIGVTETSGSLRGTLRNTFITPNNIKGKNRIPMDRSAAEDIYSRNIQIAELNALNAVQAIIAWKKYFGFYLKDEACYNSLYVIDEDEIYHET